MAAPPQQGGAQRSVWCSTRSPFVRRALRRDIVRSPFVRHALRRDVVVSLQVFIRSPIRECAKSDTRASFSALVAKLHALRF
jgi:hypothetical protein